MKKNWAPAEGRGQRSGFQARLPNPHPLGDSRELLPRGVYDTHMWKQPASSRAPMTVRGPFEKSALFTSTSLFLYMRLPLDSPPPKCRSSLSPFTSSYNWQGVPGPLSSTSVSPSSHTYTHSTAPSVGPLFGNCEGVGYRGAVGKVGVCPWCDLRALDGKDTELPWPAFTHRLRAPETPPGAFVLYLFTPQNCLMRWALPSSI